MFKAMWNKMNTDMKKQEWFLLIFIIAGALIFRLILSTKSFAIGFDEVNYLKLAASAHLNGVNHVFHTYWSPFYSIVVALFAYLVPDYEIAGRLVSMLSSTLLIVPLFFFVKTHFNKKVAFAVAILGSCYTISAHFSVKAESDSIYSFIAVIAIILGWNILNAKSLGKSIVLGILFGCAYLTRPEGIGFLVTYSGIVFLVVIAQIFKRKSFMPYVYILMLTNLGFGVTSFPYLYFLKQHTGAWTISTKGTVNQQGEMYVRNQDKFKENPFHSLNDDNTRLVQDEIYHIGNFVSKVEQQKSDVIKVSIGSVAKKVFENFYKLVTQAFTQVLPMPLVLLLGLGLFSKSWSGKDALVNLYLLAFIIFFWFIVIPVFHITIRYFIPLIPVALIWVANGAEHFVEWFKKTIQKSVPQFKSEFALNVAGLVIVTVVIASTALLPEFGKHMQKNKYSTQLWAPAIEQKQAGLWLKNKGAKSPIIMAYNHAVSFYAGNYEIAESVEIPENRVDRLLAYANFRDVDYLVLNERYKSYHPLINHLYENKDVPPELTLIYDETSANGLRTLIYQVLKRN